MTEFTRRSILTSLGTLGLGAAALNTAYQPAANAAVAPDLNLDDPASNLEAYIRLRGDTSGEPVFDLARGQVFGLIPGEAARPLFKMIGAQRSHYSRVSTLEYHIETRYVGMLLDWQTEQPLRNWVNPYTEKRCDVPVTNYGPTNARLLSDRMAALAAVGDAPDKPPAATRPWYMLGDIVHMVDHIISPAVSALQPDADLMTFSGDSRLLAESGLSRIPSRLSFTAVESWREWMQMPQAGSLWWHVAGVKLMSASDYPGEFIAEVQRVDPAFFSGVST
jgi:hypothetical protein